MSELPSIPPGLPDDPTVTFRNVRAGLLGIDLDSDDFFRLHASDPPPAQGGKQPSAAAMLGPEGARSDLTLPSDLEPISTAPPMATSMAGGRVGRSYGFADSLRREAMLGEGGYGEVWEAEQIRLKRRIAVKRIREDIRAAPVSPKAWEAFCERYFRHEAYIAAQLDHPNIVPVHDLEVEPDGSPAIVMKLVQGRPWSELLCVDLLAMPPEELLARHLPIFTSVVQAVAFAHSRSIVHRDIKPSQVMVGDYGEVLLMDWGLAISCDPARLDEFWRPDFAPLPPTTDQAHNPAGTPSYMAPEQTREDIVLVGPWTDVFLLGSTLYLLLTGRLPYQSPTTEETFTKAARGEWAPLEDAGAGRNMPADLMELVTAAMEPDFRKRRLTARMMLERLEAFRTGATRRLESEKLTREVSDQLGQEVDDYHTFEVMGNLLSQAREYWPGNPRIPVLAESVTLGYSRIALANGDLRLARVHSDLLEPGLDRERLRESIASAEKMRSQRERQRRVAVVAALVLLVCALGAAGLAVLAMNTAEQKRELAEVATRNAIANEGEARRLGDKARREQYFAAVGYASASLSDNDMLKAETVLDNAAPQLRDWEWHYLHNLTQPETRRFTFAEPMLAVACSPDGETMAVGGENASLQLVDMVTGDVRPLVGHSLKVYSVAFSPDGRRLASGSKDTSIRLWDVDTGECVRVLEGHRDYVNSVTFHPTDNNLLLSASSDHTAILWDLTTGAARHVCKHGELVRTALFDATGERYVTATRNRTIRLVRSADGSTLSEYRLGDFTSGLTSAAFSPDNSKIVVTSWDSNAGIVDAATGKMLQLLRGHTDAPYRGCFSPDGSQVITFGHDGVAIFWNAETGERQFSLEGHSGAIWDGCLTPDGASVLTAGYDRTARLWKIADFNPRPRVVDVAALSDPMLAARGAINVPLFYLNDTTYVRVDDNWESPMGGQVVEARGIMMRVLPGNAVWSADCAARVSIGTKAVVQWPDGSRPNLELSPAPAVSASFRRDGLLAVATKQEIIVVNAALDAVVGRIGLGEGENPFYKVRFGSHSDHLVVVHDREHQVKLAVYDTSGREPMAWPVVMEHAGLYQDVDGVEVAPNGSWLAFGSLKNWDIYFLRMPSGEVMGIGSGHTDRIMDLSVSPNGRRLASIAWDGSLRIWEPETAREFLFVRPDSGAKFFAARWTEDGCCVMAPSSSGNVYMLDGTPRAEAQR